MNADKALTLISFVQELMRKKDHKDFFQRDKRRKDTKNFPDKLDFRFHFSFSYLIYLVDNKSTSRH